MSRRLVTLSSLVLAAASSLPAQADTLPARKPGLWTVTTTLEGSPMSIQSQMCIDAQTDAAMMRAAAGSNTCETPAIAGSGNQRTIDSVCHMAGSTITSHMVVTYANATTYQMEAKSKYAPPLYGQTEGAMTQDASWIGACPADMVPGDVVSNGIKVNILATMNGQ